MTVLLLQLTTTLCSYQGDYHQSQQYYGGGSFGGHNHNYDLGTFVGKHQIPPKVIRIVKTVAVKVPVPYPVRVPHTIPYPVHVPKPYPVHVPKIVHVEKQVPVHIPSPTTYNHEGSYSEQKSHYSSPVFDISAYHPSNSQYLQSGNVGYSAGHSSTDGGYGNGDASQYYKSQDNEQNPMQNQYESYGSTDTYSASAPSYSGYGNYENVANNEQAGAQEYNHVNNIQQVQAPSLSHYGSSGSSSEGQTGYGSNYGAH